MNREGREPLFGFGLGARSFWNESRVGASALLSSPGALPQTEERDQRLLDVDALTVFAAHLKPQPILQHRKQGLRALRIRLEGAADGDRFRPAADLDPQRGVAAHLVDDLRSEEHTSELQSLMRTSYAVF